MVVENGDEIIGTCHLTIMPSLTFIGSTRMQIEAVRVAGKYRGQKIGSWMFDQAISYAKENDVSITQLTTNKKRPKAKRFYEKLGFEASHEGMKLYLEEPIHLSV
jgi:ribosomal protein S18 acetylase RimI-like enzyme